MKKFFAILAGITIPAFSASAIVPLVLGAGLTVVGVAGFSIYRSMSPVNMSDAFSFFSSCWTCNLFSNIFATLSGMLPNIYSAIGYVTIPIALALTLIWITWTVLASWIGVQKPDVDMKDGDAAWNFSAKFIPHFVKLVIVSTLLLMPLPHIIGRAMVEPVFNIGLSISNSANVIAPPEYRNAFQACLVATAISESLSGTMTPDGAFSSTLRHNLTCQLAGIHQMTGLGMTVGWTMLNSAFDAPYMHKILWGIPIFPNVPLFIVGAIIIFLFFMALVPIPIYFIETIARLSLNLVMLPLFLLGWLFNSWEIFPKGTDNIKQGINELVRDVIGIATVGIFVVFSVMFMNAMFGMWEGVYVLSAALSDPAGGARILIDGLLFQNDSIVTIVMTGIFIGFFMTMIPVLVKQLFNKVEIPQKFYDKAKDDGQKAWKGISGYWKKIAN